MKKPLEGYTVIDLTTFVAAPTTARLLADMGARVIKVEPPKGDAWRSSGVGFDPRRFSHAENPIFDLYNNGKDMISLNLKTEEGMAVMQQLLSKADVFITNNRPASLARMGLDYETLHKKYPRLIYGIVLGYGQKGPDADKKAFDTTAFWARSGFLRDQAMILPDGQYEPVNAPSSVGDSYTGTVLAMQVLAAILQRQESGEGQYLSASLYHVGMFAMSTMIVKQQFEDSRVLPETRAAGRPGGGPFECADGDWIYLAEAPDLIFKLSGRQDLLEEERLQPAVRYKPENRAMLLESLRQCMKTKTADQWLEELKPYDPTTVRLPHFGANATDPQAVENDFVRKVTYSTGFTHNVPTAPFEMEQMQARDLHPTKPVGADTVKVLQELGYSEAQIKAMLEAGEAVSC